jgi:hypothetical protein
MNASRESDSNLYDTKEDDVMSPLAHAAVWWMKRDEERGKKKGLSKEKNDCIRNEWKSTEWQKRVTREREEHCVGCVFVYEFVCVFVCALLSSPLPLS